jgi:large subunit ribosomal protein L25
MEIIKLAVEVREKTGSAESRRLRRSGRLPVVLYGMGRDPSHFSVDAHRFEIEYRKGRRMFELTAGEKTQVSLLKDVGFDFLGDNPVHADFIRIDDSKPVTVTVVLDFIGVPSPVAGAVLDYVNRDIHISCLPRQIPDAVPVHLGHLTVGQHIEAGQITVPPGVTLVDPPGKTIVSYHYKHIEVVAAPVVEGVPAEPEVLTERKPTPEEEAAEKKTAEKKTAEKKEEKKK